MSDQPSPVTLRIEPHAIPAMCRALDDALVDLGRQVRRLQNEGFLPESWLGDETSIEVRDYYNRQVMSAPEGPFAALIAYEAELVRVRDTLEQMEQDYRVHEGDAATRMGRM